MPNYNFSLEDGDTLPDLDRQELPDDASAFEAARSIARDFGQGNDLAKEWTVVVRDDNGRIVATVDCGDLCE